MESKHLADLPLQSSNSIPLANDQSVPARFAHVAARHAGRLAVQSPDAEWTYAELDERSDALAVRMLEATGQSAGPVVLLLEHSAPLIAAILGVLKAGRIYLALDPGQPAEGLAAMLEDSAGALLVADAANLPVAHALAAGKIPVLEIAGKFPGARRAELTEILPASGAWLMYTSGSTGRRKGVWENHRGVLHHADVFSELIQLGPDDRVSLLTSCSLAASTSALFSALLSGATLCPFHVRTHGVERLAVWLRERRITVYHSVPTIFRHLARAANGHVFDDLRLVRLGGEPLLRDDAKCFQERCPDHCRLMNSFSSTETGLISTLTIDKQSALDRRLSVGRVVRGVEVLLLNELGQPVEAGDEGRIAVRGASLRQGYWRQPELTAQTFLANADDPQVRTFISHDLGRRLPDGSLEHLGRADRVVKIRGLRTDLAEVEAALQMTELFHETAVTAPTDAAGDRRLIAYVVPRAGVEAPLPLCRRALQSSLPEHMLPSEFVSLERLPQTAGGKIDWGALPPPRERAKSVLAPGPIARSGTEQSLTEIWEAVLGGRPIGRHDDFFELGGTSLHAAQVLARIEERFDLALPPGALLEHSTIEALALRVRQHAVIPSVSPLILLRPANTGKPFFLVHAGEGHLTTYGQLVRRLPDRPIFGFQAIGLEGDCLPLTGIPAMARRYVSELRAQHPAGPYLLGGARLGALVAFEMAQILVRQKQIVGLLALMDFSPLPTRSWFARRTKLVTDGVRDNVKVLGWALRRTLGQRRKERWLPEYQRFISRLNCRMRYRYWPAGYPGAITLFLASDSHILQPDRQSLLPGYARAARTVMIPSRRFEMFVSPGVDELARQLQAAFDDAEKRNVISAPR